MQCTGETDPSGHGRAAAVIPAVIPAGRGWLGGTEVFCWRFKMTWLKATRNLPGFVRVACMYQLFYPLFQLYAKVFIEMFTLVLFCSLVRKLSVSIRATCRCKDEEQVFVISFQS